MADASFAVDSLACLQKQILFVSSDPALTTPIEACLESGGFDILAVETARQMRAVTERLQFDAVVLDSALPDSDAWQALRWLRAHSAAPVVMLTERHGVLGKVASLQIKPDDYVPKPIDRLALVTRLRAVLHRAGQVGSAIRQSRGDVIEFADWTLDISKRRIWSHTGVAVPVTVSEGRIIVLFSENPGRVVTRDQLMEVTAGRPWEPFDRSVDVHISNLRRKLDRDPEMPSLIRTVRGAGYMFVPTRFADRDRSAAGLSRT
jgi:DNA-binding response OmpR family regulator